MGTKIYINFTKYPFQECINRLKDEVNSTIGATQTKKSIYQTRTQNNIPNLEDNNKIDIVN